MASELDLGERFMDISNDWKADGLDFTSLTLRQYQKFIEKYKSKTWNRVSVGAQFWHKVTPSQNKVMTVF